VYIYKKLNGDFFGPATSDCPTILIRGGSSGISKSVVEPSLQPPPRPDPTRPKISHPTERDIRQLEFDGETAQSAGPKKYKNFHPTNRVFHQLSQGNIAGKRIPSAELNFHPTNRVFHQLGRECAKKPSWQTSSVSWGPNMTLEARLFCNPSIGPLGSTTCSSPPPPPEVGAPELLPEGQVLPLPPLSRRPPVSSITQKMSAGQARGEGGEFGGSTALVAFPRRVAASPPCLVSKK